MKPRYDVPEPKWWSRARRLVRTMPRPEVARVLGVSEAGLRYALDPEHRQQMAARRKGNQKRSPGGPNMYRHLSEARRAAREQWRADGKVKDLEHYYRKLDCMTPGRLTTGQRAC